MKTLISILVVLLLITGSAFASTPAPGGELEQEQNQGQQQAQGQIQGQVATADNANVNVDVFEYEPTYNSEYVERTGVINPGYPAIPWQVPFQYYFWNGIEGMDGLIFQRWWDVNDVGLSLKKIRDKGIFGLEGDGFKWEIGLDDYNKRAKDKEPKLFTITQKVNMPKLLKNYKYLGAINVNSNTKRTFDQAVRKTVQVALCYDIDVVILTGDLNPVNKGSSFSPAAGFGNAGVNNSFSLISGAISGQSEVLGKPGICFWAFRKVEVNEDVVPPKEILGVLIPNGKEKKPQVTPSVIPNPAAVEKATGTK